MAGPPSTEKAAVVATSTKPVSTTPASKGGRRHGGTAATGSASDPPHVCGICNKCFDRRDLRDRHKRRCAKSATKVKVSKRKSCLACAQSKLGCDLDTPACSRCVSRGTKCEYAVPPPSALQGGLPKQMTARSHPHLALQTAQRASSFVKQNAGYQYHANNGNPELTCIPVPSSSGYPTPPFHDSMMPWHDNYQGYQSFDLFGSLTMQPFLPHVPSTPSSGHPSTGFDGSEFDSFTPHEMPPAFQDWYQDSGINSSFHAQHGSEHEQWHGDSDHKPLREVDNNAHYSSHGPVENQSFSLFHALNIPVHHDPSLSPTNSVGHVEPHSTFFNSLAMPYEVSRSGLWREPSAARTNIIKTDPVHESSGLFDHLTLASFATGASSNLQFAKSVLFGDADVTRLVQSYPAMLLQKTFYPPFVHHQLYRSAEGGLAGPLANVLCCVSAYTSMIPSNESFVYNMINNEREHLVRRFHLWSSTDVNALGALHAMCVYQIIGLLNIKDTVQFRIAELQHPFFLKMARRLCQENRCSVPAQEETMDWQTWIVEETLRRILFLVNIVNTLSRRRHPENPSYYEALDEELIFSMPLPAPDIMWKASTAEEWEIAKTKVGKDLLKPRTVHMVIDRLTEAHTDEENRAWFEDFQPLSLLSPKRPSILSFDKMQSPTPARDELKSGALPESCPKLTPDLHCQAWEELTARLDYNKTKLPDDLLGKGDLVIQTETVRRADFMICGLEISLFLLKNSPNGLAISHGSLPIGLAPFRGVSVFSELSRNKVVVIISAVGDLLPVD